MGDTITAEILVESVNSNRRVVGFLTTAKKMTKSSFPEMPNYSFPRVNRPKRIKQQVKNPLVSCIIPMYDSENTISECLKSIINIDYSPLEVIVVNDGSTDNSVEVTKSFMEKNERPALTSPFLEVNQTEAYPVQRTEE